MAKTFLICIVLFLVSIDRLYAQGDSQLADAINTYGINYYRTQIDPNQNTIASGYGFATIKTMLLVGAGGESDTDLRSQLGYDVAGLSDAQIEQSYQSILTTQRNHNSGYELDVSNSLWSQSGLNVLADYKTALANSFLAEAKTVDFRSGSAGAAIKNWVAKATRRPTTNLYRGFSDNQEQVVLMNALYFSGRMKTQFDRRQLRRRPFTEDNGTTQRSRLGLMVATTNMFNYTYSQDMDADVLALPYNGNEVSMIVVLPRSVGGLGKLEQQLTLQDLKAAKGAMTTSKVAVSMPFISDYNQVGTLSYLSLKQLDNVEDDFAGIDGEQDLYEAEDDQSDIFRYGADTIFKAGNSLRGKPDVTFNANHPFLYYFCHEPTDIILFMGRMIRPLANGIL